MKKLAILVSFIFCTVLAEPLNQATETPDYDLLQAQTDYTWATIEYLQAMIDLKACYEKLKLVKNLELSILKKVENLPDENRAEVVEKITQKLNKRKPDCTALLIEVEHAKEKLDAATQKLDQISAQRD